MRSVAVSLAGCVLLLAAAAYGSESENSSAAFEPATLADLIPHLYIPKSLSQAGTLAEKVTHYAHANYHATLAQVLLLFLLLQSLNIPGTIFLNVVMGCVFGYAEGTLMGVVSGTVGAMVAYSISKRWAQGLVLRLVAKTGMQERLRWFQDEVASEEDGVDLYLFLIFLRVSPVLPNWFINLASPHVGVPFFPLAFATAVGITPQTFIAVHAGVMLRELVETGATSPIGPREWLFLLFLGLVFLLPVLLRRVMGGKKKKAAAAAAAAAAAPSESRASQQPAGVDSRRSIEPVEDVSAAEKKRH